MTLVEAKKGFVYRIKALNCIQDELLKRLYSLGIFEGVEISIGHVSLWGHTYSVYISGTHVALRKSEAKMIEIELISNTK